MRQRRKSRVHDVTLDRVAVTLERTTQFKGGLFDNRPTTAHAAIEPHDTPGFSIEHADNVTLRNCKVKWGGNLPDDFTYAVEAKDTTGLKIEWTHRRSGARCAGKGSLHLMRALYGLKLAALAVATTVRIGTELPAAPPAADAMAPATAPKLPIFKVFQFPADHDSADRWQG